MAEGSGSTGAISKGPPMYSLNDQELVAFDSDRLTHYEDGDAASRLDGPHADVYRSHLVVALWLDGWRERVMDDQLRRLREVDDDGFEHALREVAAHLRQGDFLPGGDLADDLAA